MMDRNGGIFRRSVWVWLVAAMALLFALNLCCGSVSIPVREVIHSLAGMETQKASWDFIVRESRLPAAITAMLAGMSLAVSGLMLQTAFRNPLAGPDILGINAGAGLGVAIVMLSFGGSLSVGSMALGASVSVIVGAFVGAMAVMGLILLLSARMKNYVMLLIAGIMISYLTSSMISLLNFFSTAEGVHSYTIWGMGNFGGVSLRQIPFFTVVSLIGLALGLSLIKPLNAILLGDNYAQNLGINLRRTRLLMLLSTGLSVAVTTSFCGPVSFIGLAVPHLARLLLGSENHRSLMPVSLMTGGIVALLCNVLSSLPGDRGVIPLNAITPAIGAPVILYVLLKQFRH